MGKGDVKTRKGKRFRKSYGNKRAQTNKKPFVAEAPKAKAKAKPKKAPAKKKD